LWYCSYGRPITLAFQDSDALRVQFPYSGTGATLATGRSIPVGGQWGCISHSAKVIEFGADFSQILWRLDIHKVIQKISAITGKPITQKLTFSPSLDLTSDRSADLMRIMLCTLASVGGSSPSLGQQLVLAELEQALIVSLLFASDHSCLNMIKGQSPGIASWQVLRAESYIEANWNKPIHIEDLVSVTNASARSIFRTFKQSRGYSPLEFVKNVRLQHAKQMLTNAENPLSVTEVSLLCGYGDIGNFSKDFRKAYGETPSTVGKRKN
jgi:AraC-like DNA-binding protein